jgi:hypothetical protein
MVLRKEATKSSKARAITVANKATRSLNADNFRTKTTENKELEMVETKTMEASKELALFAERKVIERSSADNKREATIGTTTRDIIRMNTVRATLLDMWRPGIVWSARKNRKLAKAMNMTNSTHSSIHLVGRTPTAWTNRKV